MKTRSLGTTDIQITPIGLGVMQFAGGKGIFRYMFPEIPPETKDEIVQTALDGGINWFDTAELYGRGASEEGLAKALHTAGKSDDEVIVATKWNPLLRTAGNIPRTIDTRLKYLDGYTVDLYQIHQPVSFSSPENEMEAMADLVEAGKIRTVGVSNFSAAYTRRSHAALQKRGLPLVSNQVQYSLLERGIETNGILDAAKELGVTIIAWSPLASGILSGKFHQNPSLLDKTPVGRRSRIKNSLEKTRPLIEALKEIGANYDASPSQVALNWLIHFQGNTVVAIPGASKVRHAAEAAAVMNFKLSDEEINRLDELTRQYR